MNNRKELLEFLGIYLSGGNMKCLNLKSINKFKDFYIALINIKNLKDFKSKTNNSLKLLTRYNSEYDIWSASGTGFIFKYKNNNILITALHNFVDKDGNLFDEKKNTLYKESLRISNNPVLTKNNRIEQNKNILSFGNHCIHNADKYLIQTDLLTQRIDEDDIIKFEIKNRLDYQIFNIEEDFSVSCNLDKLIVIGFPKNSQDYNSDYENNITKTTTITSNLRGLVGLCSKDKNVVKEMSVVEDFCLQEINDSNNHYYDGLSGSPIFKIDFNQNIKLTGLVISGSNNKIRFISIDHILKNMDFKIKVEKNFRPSSKDR